MEDTEGPSFKNWDRWNGEDILVGMIRCVAIFFAVIILLVVLIYNLGWGEGLIYSALIIAAFVLGSFKKEILKFIKKVFKVHPKIKFGKLKA